MNLCACVPVPCRSAGPARSGGVVGKDGKRVYNRTVPTFGDIISHGLFPPGPCRWTVGTIKEEVSVEVRPSGTWGQAVRAARQ